MNSNFSEGIRDFINNLTEMQTFLEVFDSITNMVQCGGDLETYTGIINFKLLPMIWEEVLTKLTNVENPDASKVTIGLELIQKSQSLGINQDQIINILLDRVFEYIKDKFGFEENDKNKIDNSDEARAILSVIENITISNSELANDFNSLKEVYGVILKVPKVIAEYNAQVGLNFTGFHKAKDIHVYMRNPNFNVRVEKYKSSNRVMAVKTYEPKDQPLNMKAIAFEINALELLSSKADNTNAFLKYYGCTHHDNKVYIGMEYQKITLADKIKLMAESKPKKSFTKEELLSHIQSLLTSFALMEDLNIYHRDIKPSNILVSKTNLLKIIDFGAGEFKDTTDQTTTNKVNFVVGTPAFMAPEIYEAHLANKDTAIFARGTSDVFSLGMTILQMIVMRDLSTLNMIQNNERLLKIVENEVREEWIKSLLLAMLNLDYKKRPRFNNCLKYIQSGYTKTYIQKN